MIEKQFQRARVLMASCLVFAVAVSLGTPAPALADTVVDDSEVQWRAQPSDNLLIAGRVDVAQSASTVTSDLVAKPPNGDLETFDPDGGGEHDLEASIQRLHASEPWVRDEPMPELQVVAMLLPTDLSRAGERALPIVDRTTTDAQGRFSLHATTSDVKEGIAGPDGEVTLAVHVRDGDEVVGMRHMTIYPPPTVGGPWRAENPAELTDSSSSAAGYVEFLVSDNGMRSRESLLPESEIATKVPVRASSADLTLEPTEPSECSHIKLGIAGEFTTFLTDVGTNSTYVNYQYILNADGADTDSVDIGVGYSKSGISGSFTSSGTTKTTASTTMEWSERGEDGYGDRVTYFHTKTRYRNYKQICPHPVQTGGTISYLAWPESITGDMKAYGTVRDPDPHRSWVKPIYRGYCTQIDRAGNNGPGKLSRKYGTTTTYSSGVQGTFLGSSLEVKNSLAGGTSHDIIFKNYSRYTKFVCGKYSKIGYQTRYSGRLFGDHIDWTP